MSGGGGGRGGGEEGFNQFYSCQTSPLILMDLYCFVAVLFHYRDQTWFFMH